MTEKRSQKNEISKSLSLVCHIENFKVRHAGRLGSRFKRSDFNKARSNQICGAVRSLNFVTSLPIQHVFLHSITNSSLFLVINLIILEVYITYLILKKNEAHILLEGQVPENQCDIKS
jgi:hypothetical protein